MAASTPPLEGAPVKIVVCPQCGGDSVYAPSNPYRPFCCERCKKIDLGAWASESYRMEQKPGTEEEGYEPPDS